MMTDDDWVIRRHDRAHTPQRTSHACGATLFAPVQRGITDAQDGWWRLSTETGIGAVAATAVVGLRPMVQSLCDVVRQVGGGQPLQRTSATPMVVPTLIMA